MRVLVLVTILAFMAPIAAQPVATLTPKDVADAITLGNFGEPRPYALHGRSVDPTRRNPVELAAVYTPFVRVALAARAARDAGHVLMPEDVDPKLLEPLAYMAFRWFASDSEHPDSDYTPAQLYWIFKRDIDPHVLLLTARKGIDPIWVKRGGEASAVLSTFGAEPPYDDVVLVAAVPIELLRTDGWFVIYRRFIPVPARPPYPAGMVTEGEISPDELAGWR